MSELNINITQKKYISEIELFQLTELINKVYKSSESEFWPSDGSYTRTNIDEIADFISKEEMIVAYLDSEIVGSVHIYPINKTTLGFGMLTCSLNHRKKGIGNELLKFIETYATKNHFKIIQLELLKPTLDRKSVV